MFYVFMLFCKLHLSKDLRPLRGNNKKKRTNGGNIIFFCVIVEWKKNYRTQWSKTGRQWGAQNGFIGGNILPTEYQTNELKTQSRMYTLALSHNVKLLF